MGTRRAPISSSTRTTPCIGGPGGQRRSPRPSARASRSCSRSATPPAIGATSWRMRASRTTRPRQLMNDALRQHQGRSRGAAGRRRHLHGGAARCWASRAAGRSPCSSPRRRAVLGRHLLSARAALRPPGLRARAEGDRSRLSRRAGQGAAERRRAERPRCAETRWAADAGPTRSRATRRSPILRGACSSSSIPTTAASSGAPKFPQRGFFSFCGARGCATACPIRFKR